MDNNFSNSQRAEVLTQPNHYHDVPQSADKAAISGTGSLLLYWVSVVWGIFLKIDGVKTGGVR